MANTINILSTKKLSPNQNQTMISAGFEVIEKDFIATKSINFELSNVNDNLIFTSQNAVESVLEHPKCGDLKGKNVRDVLPNTLKENQVTFNEIEVYQTSFTSHKMKSKHDGILFFSPSAVESYLKTNSIKNEVCFCIGETTAEALENRKIKKIVIAEQPTIENVIAEVIEYY